MSKPHALFESHPGSASRRVIFDTASDPAEARLYGDDMRLVVATPARGLRILTLAGPDGEVALDQIAWRHVVSAMKLTGEAVR